MNNSTRCREALVLMAAVAAACPTIGCAGAETGSGDEQTATKAQDLSSSTYLCSLFYWQAAPDGGSAQFSYWSGYWLSASRISDTQFVDRNYEGSGFDMIFTLDQDMLAGSPSGTITLSSSPQEFAPILCNCTLQ